MNLSLDRKWGMLRVRAGRLLAVAHPHQVTTSTLSHADPEVSHRRKFAADEKWVTTNVGDLALEILAVKTGKVIGYSYLCGPATQLHLYSAGAPAHWFAPARAIRGDLSELPVRMADPPKVIAGFMKLKYQSAAQLVVVELVVPTKEAVHEALEFLKGVIVYMPTSMTDDAAKTDLTAAHVIARVGVAGKKTPVGLLHYQPPRHAAGHSSSGFQQAMAIEGPWEVVNPWAADVAAVG